MTDKNRIAQSLGVTFGDKQHNRNLTSAQCGAVGGQMVKEALEQAWGTAEYATINPAFYSNATSNIKHVNKWN